MKVLILGYGNADRQDDGVAWYVLTAVMRHFGFEPPLQPEDELPVITGDLEFQFHLQLFPELADELGNFDKVVFIDAHTGHVPEEVHQEQLTPHYQSSPLTHHMTAATLLSLCDVIHHRFPDAILVSVRGYEFEFSRTLSNQTNLLVEDAVSLIVAWINQSILALEE